jgi:hypothetical protein
VFTVRWELKLYVLPSTALLVWQTSITGPPPLTYLAPVTFKTLFNIIPRHMYVPTQQQTIHWQHWSTTDTSSTALPVGRTLPWQQTAGPLTHPLWFICVIRNLWVSLNTTMQKRPWSSLLLLQAEMLCVVCYLTIPMSPCTWHNQPQNVHQ